jgi:hypothetical protein
MASSSSKGNPASHRMSNAHLKDARSRRWRNGQTRKQARIDTQATHESANRKLRSAGQPTPWQVACAERAARRTPRKALA